MKNRRLFVASACLSVSIFAITSANAGSFTVDDSTAGATSYWGGNVLYDGNQLPSWSDIHGPASYGVDSLTISVTASNLTAIVTGPFISFANSTQNNYGIRPGDLFFSNTGWNPHKNDLTDNNYVNDNAANGEQWDYVISMTNNTGFSGAINLYTVDTLGDIVFPEEVLTSLLTAEYRTGQEYRYNTAPGQTSLGIGTWSISGDILTYVLDLSTVSGTTIADLFKNNGVIGVHWGMTCGNDVIEGVGSPVPEPATMILFGTGLMGLAGMSRRKKK